MTWYVTRSVFSSGPRETGPLAADADSIHRTFHRFFLSMPGFNLAYASGYSVQRPGPRPPRHIVAPTRFNPRRADYRAAATLPAPGGANLRDPEPDASSCSPRSARLVSRAFSEASPRLLARSLYDVPSRCRPRIVPDGGPASSTSRPPTLPNPPPSRRPAASDHPGRPTPRRRARASARRIPGRPSHPDRSGGRRRRASRTTRAAIFLSQATPESPG